MSIKFIILSISFILFIQFMRWENHDAKTFLFAHMKLAFIALITTDKWCLSFRFPIFKISFHLAAICLVQSALPIDFSILKFPFVPLTTFSGQFSWPTGLIIFPSAYVFPSILVDMSSLSRKTTMIKFTFYKTPISKLDFTNPREMILIPKSLVLAFILDV